MAGLSEGDQRSLLNTAEGVVDGTVESTPGTGSHPAPLLPELRYEVSPSPSDAQSGPLSRDWMAPPPALTRYSTLVAPVAWDPPMKTVPGSEPVAVDARGVPPA